MKQVIEQYGLTCIAMFFLSVVLFWFCSTNYGIRKMIRTGVETGEVQESIVTGGDAFEQYMNHVSPRICLEHPYVLKVGEKIDLQEMFIAIGVDNTLLPVSMIGCWGIDGAEGEISYTDEKHICASNQGIYWMNIYAVDNKGRDREVLLKVFVNAR